MSAQHKPLRVGLLDVAARRRAELARTSPAAPSAPPPSPTLAAPPERDPVAVLNERRANLVEKVARLQGAMRGTAGRHRAELGAEIAQANAALTKINVERRALVGPSVGEMYAAPLRIVASLLEVLDRAQDEGFVRSDADVAQLDAAASWLEANGAGDR